MVCGTDDFEANDICALYNNIKESNKNKDNNTAAKLEFKGVKISPCIDFGSFEELIHHTWLSTFTCPKDGYVVFDIENKDIEADLLINTTHGFGDGDKICKYHFNCNDKNKLLFVKAGMKLCINITYNNNASWEDGNNLIYYISFECSMEEDNK